MPIFLDVQIDGSLKKLIRRLNDMPDKAVGRKKMRIIAGGLKSFVNNQFIQGINPYGVKWEDLKPKTIIRKRRSKRSLKVLRATGRLQDTMFAEFKDRTVRLAFPRRYRSGHGAEIHQEGRGFNPVRLILPVTTLPRKWRDFIVSTIRDGV